MKASEVFEFLKSVFSIGKIDDVGKKHVPYALALSREKTELFEKDEAEKRGELLETFRSNRCQFNLDHTIVVIRTQFIYQALRYASLMIDDYETKGPFSERTVNWDKMWQESHSPHDMSNQNFGWIQVYVDGRCLFATTKNPHLDVIEKCIMVGELKSYDDALLVAEKLFEDSGRPVFLKTDTILTVNLKETQDNFNCGFINSAYSHGGDQSSNVMFSMRVAKQTKNPPKVQQILMTGADFIESIHLTSRMNFMKKKAQDRTNKLTELEIEQAGDIRLRRNKLEARIDTFESIYTIKYRPERPILKQEDDFLFF